MKYTVFFFSFLLVFISCSQDKLPRKLQEALKDPEHVTKIDLSKSELRSIPAEIIHLVNLEELNLSYNELQTLPSFLGGFNKLKRLYLDGNKLDALPLELQELTGLEVLSLSDNNLNDVPNFIWTAYPNMQNLFLNNSGIRGIPEDINLSRLTWLSMENNELTSLPDALYHLKNLSVLNVNSNQISKLTNDIGQWKVMSDLYLGYNLLENLPDSLAALSAINVLEISGNQFCELPSVLMELHNLKRLLAHSNQIDTIPESIKHLKQLSVLNLDSNKIVAVPASMSDLHSLFWIFLRQNKIHHLPDNMASFPVTLLALDCNPIDPKAIKALKEKMACNILFGTVCE